MAKRKNYAPVGLNKIPIFLSIVIIGIGIFVFMLSLRGLTTPSDDVSVPVEDMALEKEEFINQLVPVAKELNQAHGILPSIILGQAILESDWGRSELSAKYNNLFGIKSFSPHDDSVKLKTKEFKDGKWIEINANFKVYASWSDCMKDHTLLFVNGVDWDPYLYQGVLLASDYTTAAKALQASGYATDPDYASKVISVIEKYELYQYDK
ncbi:MULTISPECIES: glycoside hydrolase family 73 protein [Vagococcus]|uniref:N-acetylmuramoyl-L-alanine amidase n=1 Tax=Vagococcus fluvialis bH819 TaxID=1255619 RepID=A0A1X6WM24_9ENTE|nr:MULTISPECIES: glycoside hydrolase family 73 protein [Vagococcus]SLM85319.1 N-acetylmuramoyl-L-alanine amidase [Vagococcus fluvialis bH819]HCM89386.1 N-acetylmuramoyl-L-alanine amidase [Vagococcus sp.]